MAATTGPGGSVLIVVLPHVIVCLSRLGLSRCCNHYSYCHGDNDEVDSFLLRLLLLRQVLLLLLLPRLSAATVVDAVVFLLLLSLLDIAVPDAGAQTSIRPSQHSAFRVPWGLGFLASQRDPKLPRLHHLSPVLGDTRIFCEGLQSLRNLLCASPLHLVTASRDPQTFNISPEINPKL